MGKEFVLGMEALLIPNAIRQFDGDNTIIIPMATIEELQNYNGYPEEVRNAKKLLEHLTDLGIEELVKNGITQENGSLLKVELDPKDDFAVEELKLTRLSDYDKRRFRVCKFLQQDARERGVNKVILISMNPLTRIKAAIAGIKAEEPTFQLFPKLDEQYKGSIYATVSPKVMQELYSKGFIKVEQLINYKQLEILPNMFISIKDSSESMTALAVYTKGKVSLIKEENLNLPPKFHPIKKTQNFLLWALNASPEDVPYVIVKGAAGTGKTFCSLLMGLARTKGITWRDATYNRVLVSAPMLEEKVKKIGAVKGGLEDKLNPYTAGILDNVNELFSNKYLKYQRNQTSRKDREGRVIVENAEEEKYDELRAIMDDGLFRIISLDLLRGRTFTKSYYIVDEAQNIRPDEMRTLLTRLGEGAKMILLGDPSQTDASGLTERYNGLTYASEKLKGSSICAQITFDDDETVRSKAVKEILRIFN